MIMCFNCSIILCSFFIPYPFCTLPWDVVHRRWEWSAFCCFSVLHMVLYCEGVTVLLCVFLLVGVVVLVSTVIIVCTVYKTKNDCFVFECFKKYFLFGLYTFLLLSTPARPPQPPPVILTINLELITQQTFGLASVFWPETIRCQSWQCQ